MSVTSRLGGSGDGTTTENRGEVSSVWEPPTGRQVRLITCSDLHLREDTPLARKEKDWYGVMARYLGQLGAVAYKFRSPIVYAGDIFHRWNSSAELINFAITHLPMGYAIP